MYTLRRSICKEVSLELNRSHLLSYYIPLLTLNPSDLLSRHVNKCHAATKPPTTTQPARRKGHAQPGTSTSGVRGPGPALGAPPGSAGGSLDGVAGLPRRICDACGLSRTPAQCDAGVPCGKSGCILI